MNVGTHVRIALPFRKRLCYSGLDEGEVHEGTTLGIAVKVNFPKAQRMRWIDMRHLEVRGGKDKRKTQGSG